MRLNWSSILYAIIIGIEACWLYTILALANNSIAEGRLSVFGLLALYLLSFVFNRLLSRSRWHRVLLRTINWLVWVGAMLLVVKVQLYSDLPWSDTSWLWAVPRAIADLIYGFKPELLVLLSSGVLWWLGRRLAGLKPGFVILVSEFQFGLVVLLVTLFVAAQKDIGFSNSLVPVLLFFLFSLVGISIAHARESTSWLSGLYRGHWSMLLLTSVGGIILLGWLIGFLLTPDFLQLVLDGLKWLWGLIMRVIDLLLSLLPKPGPSEMPTPLPTPLEPNPTEETLLWNIPENVLAGLRIGWFVLVGGSLAFALWRISSQVFDWLRRRLAGGGAEVEPMPGAFKSDLIGWLLRIGKFLARVLLKPFSPRSRPLSSEAASVRQMYRQFLRWAAGRGYPRRLSQTPREYMSSLKALLPEAEPDLDFITRHYVRVRYGPYRAEESELRQIKQSWHNIKRSRFRKSS